MQVPYAPLDVLFPAMQPGMPAVVKGTTTASAVVQQALKNKRQRERRKAGLTRKYFNQPSAPMPPGMVVRPKAIDEQTTCSDTVREVGSHANWYDLG